MGANVTNVRIAGALTSSALGVATIACGVAAAVTTAGTVATVVYAIFTVLAAGASIASLTAWASDDSQDVASYYATLGKHMLFAIPAAIQFIGQMLAQALVQGVANGVSKAVTRKIAGDDQTITVRHTN